MADQDAFTRAYITTALWSSTDDQDMPLLDQDYGLDDLAPETLVQIIQECHEFLTANREDINAGTFTRTRDADSEAGHDFWLTRNGHGAGFWDGDWREPAATRLTDASHKAGERNLYVGDDGRIYCGEG